MDVEQFDRWTRGLNERLPRRSLAGIGAGALAMLGLGAGTDDADAKKKKKKKKKKKNNPPPPPPLPPPPPGASFTCQNLGTACSANTLVCNCRLNKTTSEQQCLNVVQPPNGVAFQFCQTQANCPAGEFCDFGGSVCRTGCPTG